MKKWILYSFFVFGLFLFLWCSNSLSKKSQVNTVQNNVSIHLTDDNRQDIIYHVPSNIFSGNFTWRIEKTSLFVNYPDEEEATLFMGHDSITGNMYTYYFDDLNIKITFDDPAASYFNPQNSEYFEPYMFYSWNTLFYGKPTNKYFQFIAIFSKDTTTKLYDVIQKNHTTLLKNGCIPKLWEGEFDLLSWTESTYDIYYLTKHDWNMCFLWLFFIMNKNNPDRYYLISYADACAPSCNTFTRIDFEYNK